MMVTVYAWVKDGEILYKVGGYSVSGKPAVYLDRRRALRQQAAMERRHPGCELLELGELDSLREDRDRWREETSFWRERWTRQHGLTLRWMEALSSAREGMQTLLSRQLAGAGVRGQNKKNRLPVKTNHPIG